MKLSNHLRTLSILTCLGISALSAQKAVAATPLFTSTIVATQDLGPSLAWQGSRSVHPQFTVNLANGNVQFALPGAGYRFVSRSPSPGNYLFFNSRSISKTGDYTGGFNLGQGWSTVVGSRLEFPTPTTALYTTGGGYEISFTKVGSVWEAMAGSRLHLVSSNPGWRISNEESRKWHFDGAGRLVKVASAEDNELTIQHGSGGVLGTTDPIGRPCTFIYSGGRLAQMTISGSHVWTYSYDSSNRLDSVTTPWSETTSVAYDTTGRISTLIDPSGNQWQFTYFTSGTWSGRVQSMTGPDGLVETYAYTLGPRDVRTKVTDAHGKVWSYFHETGSKPALLRIRNPLGKWWSRTYNADREQTTAINPLGHTYTYVYDSDGNVLSRTKPSGIVSTYTHNAARRMLSATLDGHTSNFIYGDVQNPLLMTRELQPTNASGQRATTDFTYYGPNDGPVPGVWHGLLESVTDPNGVETRFEYRSNGFIKAINEGPAGLSGGVEIRYDASGKRVHTGLGGMQYPAHFPALPPLPAQIAGPMEQTNLNPLDIDWRGLRTLVEYAVGVPINASAGLEASSKVVSSRFDHFGRTTVMSTRTDEIFADVGSPPAVAPARTFNATYHDGPLDPRTVIASPDGDTVTTRRDGAGLIKSLTAVGAGGESLSVVVHRRADGRVSSIVRSDGITASSGYTVDGQPSVVVYLKDGVRILTLIYDYDDRGLTESITEMTSTGTTVKSYLHDSQKQLTQELMVFPTGSSRQINYSYDLGGNRRSRQVKVDGALTESDIYHYDIDSPTSYSSGNNRLVWLERRDGQATLVATEWFFYDNPFGHVSRAVRSNAGSQSYAATAYVYDADGKPWLSWDETWSDIGAGPTNHLRGPVLETRQSRSRKRVWRQRDGLTMEPIGTTEWSTRYGPMSAAYSVDPNNGALSRIHLEIDGLGRMGGGNLETYMSTPLGAIRLRDSSSGTVEQDSSAFGEPLLADPGSDLGFAGGFGLRDSLNGAALPGESIHMGYRHYSPKYGRFLMRDPIGLSGGINVYAFVKNSPTAAADPSGLSPDVTDWIGDRLDSAFYYFFPGSPIPEPVYPPPAPEPEPEAPTADPHDYLVPVPPRPTGREPITPVAPTPPEPPKDGGTVSLPPPYVPKAPEEGYHDENFVWQPLRRFSPVVNHGYQIPGYRFPGPPRIDD